MKNLAYLIVFITLAACQKEIDIDLNSSDTKVVIEAEINNRNQSWVKISKTLNFSESNNYPNVENATVTIADDAGNSTQLTYTANGVYTSNNLAGVAGRIYTLTVLAEGKTYTAQSIMPNLVNLDTAIFIPSNFAPPGAAADSSFATLPIYIDPAAFGNSYRFIQTINGKKDPSFLIANDNINNGAINQRPIFSFEYLPERGDTLILEMQSINTAAYDYFNSLNQSAGEGPGGGATPANPVSNLQGGALGYFSAYSSQIKTYIVP